MKSGKKCFTKIRKWAVEVGATIHEWEHSDTIIIEYKGVKYRAEQRESSSTRVISRGRGTKWSGSPSGFYFGQDDRYIFESTQTKAIKTMMK
jgi:hypothetical protein